MKQIISILLSAVLLISITGCNSSASSSQTELDKTSTSLPIISTNTLSQDPNISKSTTKNQSWKLSYFSASNPIVKGYYAQYNFSLSNSYAYDCASLNTTTLSGTFQQGKTIMLDFTLWASGNNMKHTQTSGIVTTASSDSISVSATYKDGSYPINIQLVYNVVN